MISTLTGVVPRVVGYQGFDGERIESFPLFDHMPVSRSDTLTPFLPEDLNPGQRELTEQGHSLSFAGVYVCQRLGELCWDGYKTKGCSTLINMNTQILLQRFNHSPPLTVTTALVVTDPALHSYTPASP